MVREGKFSHWPGWARSGVRPIQTTETEKRGGYPEENLDAVKVTVAGKTKATAVCFIKKLTAQHFATNSSGAGYEQKTGISKRKE